MTKILITHPGKLGDLIYSLGAIKALSETKNKKITVLTSTYCQSAYQLLLAQEYIEAVKIDFNYKPIHEHRGYQPHSLSLLEGDYDVFELGYREKDDYDLHNQHLKGYAFYVLEKFYGLTLSDKSSISITVPFDQEASSESYFVFQGLGETLDVIFGPKKVTEAMIHWAAVIKSSGEKIVVLTGPRETQRYRSLGFETLTSLDLLSSAQILKNAKGVIASQSVLAAIANEMQLPRLILNVFKNAVPTGRYGAQIPLLDQSLESAEFLVKWMKGGAM